MIPTKNKAKKDSLFADFRSYRLLWLGIRNSLIIFRKVTDVNRGLIVYCTANDIIAWMKTAYLLLFLLHLTAFCYGQSGPYMFSGAGYQGNGQIGLLTEDAEAAIVLPALLASRTQGGWSVAAATRTGLSDLTEISGAAHLVLPWKDQVAIGIQYTGIEGYAEQRISFSYARRLFEKLNTAVQFDLNRNEAEEFDNIYAASWSVSFHAPLMDELSMSAWIYNPLGSETVLDLPSMARIGVLYTPSDKIGIAVEAEKDWRHDLRFKAGINYHLHPRLAIRWGIGTNPSLVHAGITWNIFDSMALTGGWRYHSRLGSSLSASLSQYRIK
jgi:hypothetical protein